MESETLGFVPVAKYRKAMSTDRTDGSEAVSASAAAPDARGAASQRYAAQGFIVIPGAIDPVACRRFGRSVQTEFSKLHARRVTMSGSLAGHLNFSMGPGGRELLSLIKAAGIPELLARLAGEPLVLAQAMGNLNIPGSTYQNYHIDGAFDRRSMIVNVCLISTDETNGATELVRTSNLSKQSYWRFRRDVQTCRCVRPVLDPGDILIRPSNLWHRGTPNWSGEPRPMAAFVYTPPIHLDGIDPEAELSRPIVISGNKFYGHFRWLKEVIAVKLPWLDDAMRQGRSWLGERQ